MKCILYIDNEKIGEVDFTIVDESMGGISGDLIAENAYRKYRSTIQKHFKLKGISNAGDFNFRITLENGTELKPEGGIGIIDCPEFEELRVELSGVDLSIFNIFSSNVGNAKKII
jgi:hypothetical protein